MEKKKKVEIIAGYVEFQKVLDVVDAMDLKYTFLSSIAGKGAHGLKEHDTFFSVLKNSYLIAVCSEKQAKEIEDKINPLLKQFGGILIITDCMATKNK